MIKLIGNIGVGLSKETSQEKITERSNIFIKYKLQNKILGDFIIVSDNVIELRFTDKTSAEGFVAEMQAVYSKYDDTITVEYI